MEPDTINNSSAAYELLKDHMRLDVEEFHVLSLDSLKKVIDGAMIHRGTVDACMVHPRDVFRVACINNASTIIVAHSHPTGNSAPSFDDKSTTKRLRELGELMQIPVVDHLIITKRGYYSFADGGWL